MLRTWTLFIQAFILEDKTKTMPSDVIKTARFLTEPLSRHFVVETHDQFVLTFSVRPLPYHYD